MKIDVVILWVDPNDEKWQKEKKFYENEEKENNNDSIIDSSIERYRDFDNLKYIFRGIEKFIPWVNKVFLVTCGQKPKWINTEYEKLVLVNHSDFMDSEHLPTFNCNAIELNLNKIKDLSEHFIYFNDDMFVIDKMKEIDFFKNGLPCESAILNTVTPKLDNVVNKIWFNNCAVINRNFNKNKSIKENWNKWFSLKYGKELIRTISLNSWNNFVGFKFSHLPTSLLKSTYEEIWKKEFDVMNETSGHRFRSDRDVSQYLIKDWQIAQGKFYPRNIKIGNVFELNDENAKDVSNIIKKQKYKMICMNDANSIKEFDYVKEQVNGALQEILPDKSRFEK